MDRNLDADIHQAIAHLNAGRRQAALDQFLSWHKSDVTAPSRCNLIGLIHLSAEAKPQALAWFERASAVSPAFPEASFNRGLVLLELARDGEALTAFDEALKLGFSNTELFYHRGNLLRAQGQLEAAIASYDRALQLQPAYPQALHAGGQVLQNAGQLESALEFFDEALRLKPDFIEASIDRGNVLQGLERFDAALATYDAALVHAPDHADLLNNRGVALQRLGRFEEALLSLDAAIQLDPGLPEAWFNRGNVLLQMGEPEDALASFEAALTIRPSYAEALCSRAVALKHAGRMDEALAAFDIALAQNPASTHAKNNKAALLLLRGDFENGLEGYEFRWIAGQTPKAELDLAVPEWSGQIVPGERIIVFDEQGLGDAIQFSRYLPLLAEAGVKVTFFCRRRMQRLLAGLDAPIRITDHFEANESFDSQIALSSLPRAIKTRLDTIPARPAYLQAAGHLISKWAGRIGNHGFRIGLCWHGSPNLNADPARSIPLGAFAPLAKIKGLRLISIQKVDGLSEFGDDAPFQIETLGEDFDAGPDAFIDTAAAMQNLDLIITCDTSIAHLAGALGRPVWVLLKQVPDWRWLLEREDSPWYPTMRLFRQNQRGDWQEVVKRVEAALRMSLNEAQDRI